MAILVIFLVLYQLQDIRNMGLKLIAGLKLQIACEKFVYFEIDIEVYDDCEKWQASHPNKHSAIEVIVSQHEPNQKHKWGPEIVSRANLEEFRGNLWVIGLADGIAPELPKREKKQDDDIEGIVAEWRKTKEELKNDLVYNEYNFPIWILSRSHLFRCKAGLKEG